MELNADTEFWVTDPPASFENPTEGTIFLLVFSDRRKLLDFYRETPGLPKITRQTPFRRPWKRLQRDVIMLGWNGVNIDPSAKGETSTLVLLHMESPPAQEPKKTPRGSPLAVLAMANAVASQVLPSHAHRENLMLQHDAADLLEDSSKSG